MAVQISAPYFTPFMLGPLKLSYGEYAVLTGTAFVARIVALPALGSLAHRTGSRRVLWIASLGIVPLPSLWLVSQHFAWLLVVQVAAGVAWGAFELATLLVFFDDIDGARAHQRALDVQPGQRARGGARRRRRLAALPRLGPELPGYAVLFLVSSSLRIAGLRLAAAFDRLVARGRSGRCSGRAAGRSGCSRTARTRARTSPRRGSWRTPA